MSHQSQTRKAQSLFGLILLTGLFCAAQSASVFTQGPAVSKQGDSAVVITFTVSESTDVEVGIVDTASGKIINHLAAGVLGGACPPPEPLVAGLTQSIVWNLKDDDGNKITGDGCKVRVRLGVKPKFVWKTGGPAWGIGYNEFGLSKERRPWAKLELGGAFNFSQIPDKYNNGSFVYAFKEMVTHQDSSIMVLLKREADFFVAHGPIYSGDGDYREIHGYEPYLSRYTDTGDSIVSSDFGTYRIYKTHGKAGDRFFLPASWQGWGGFPHFCFIDSGSFVWEGEDPWNLDPQTDFLPKWHPLMTGPQTPGEGYLYNDHTEDWFYAGYNKMKCYDAATGKFIKDVSNDGSGWAGSILRGFSFSGLWPFEKGCAVGPGGEVYVNTIDPEDPASVWLQVKVIKNGSIIDPSRIRVHGCFSTIQVDRKGSIFVGCLVYPKGPDGYFTMPEDVRSLVNPPPPYINLDAISRSTACILKFPNTGGTLLPTTTGDYDYVYSPGQWCERTLKASGLTWGYFGYSKVYDHFEGACWCYSANFDVDNWGRLFIPNTFQAEMAVIDNNRNVIFKLKNRDIPETNIIPASMIATDNYLVVNDPMNRTTTGFRLDAQSSWFVDIATGEAYNNIENRLNASSASISAWPNPFVSSIGFKYVIPADKNGLVNLGVYDLQGRLIRELVNSSRTSGVYNIHWDGIDSKGVAISNGVYVYRFKTNGCTLVGRIAVLR